MTVTDRDRNRDCDRDRESAVPDRDRDYDGRFVLMTEASSFLVTQSHGSTYPNLFSPTH